MTEAIETPEATTPRPSRPAAEHITPNAPAGCRSKIRLFWLTYTPVRPREADYRDYNPQTIGEDLDQLDWAIRELKERADDQDLLNAEHTEKTKALLTSSSLIVASSLAAGIYSFPKQIDISSWAGLGLAVIVGVFALLLAAIYQAVQLRQFSRSPDPILIAQATLDDPVDARRAQLDWLVEQIVENDVALDFRGRWIVNGWIMLGFELTIILIVVVVRLLVWEDVMIQAQKPNPRPSPLKGDGNKPEHRGPTQPSPSRVPVPDPVSLPVKPTKKP